VDGGLNQVVGDNYIVFQLDFLTKSIVTSHSNGRGLLVPPSARTTVIRTREVGEKIKNARQILL